MLTYVTLYKYTDQGIRKIKESPSRVEQSRKAVEKAGGKLKALYLTMGQYDIVAISEWQSEEAAAAFQLGLGAAGNVTSETLRAFDEGEMKKIVAAIP